MFDYPFPGPDPRLEPRDRPIDAVRKLQTGSSLDEEEIGNFLDWLVYYTRGQLDKRLKMFAAIRAIEIEHEKVRDEKVEAIKSSADLDSDSRGKLIRTEYELSAPRCSKRNIIQNHLINMSGCFLGLQGAVEFRQQLRIQIAAQEMIVSAEIPLPDIQDAYLKGDCYTALAIMGYALDDLKIPYQEFDIRHGCSSKSLPGSRDIYSEAINKAYFKSKYKFAHVAAMLPVLAGDKNKYFLLDSTFRQFCDPDDRELKMPGFILSKTQEGREILDRLLIDGWLELTPEIAQIYLSAFSQGQQWFRNSAQKAFNFMIKPIAPFGHRFPRNTVGAQDLSL